MNKFIGNGRLTKDIELRRTADGTPYALFTLAINGVEEDQTQFVPCKVWSKKAEAMAQHLNKGSLINVEGALEVFTQQKDGQYDTRVTVVVQRVNFLESNNSAEVTDTPQQTGVDTEQVKF